MSYETDVPEVVRQVEESWWEETRAGYRAGEFATLLGQMQDRLMRLSPGSLAAFDSLIHDLLDWRSRLARYIAEPDFDRELQRLDELLADWKGPAAETFHEQGASPNEYRQVWANQLHILGQLIGVLVAWRGLLAGSRKHALNIARAAHKTSGGGDFSFLLTAGMFAVDIVTALTTVEIPPLAAATIVVGEAGTSALQSALNADKDKREPQYGLDGRYADRVSSAIRALDNAYEATREESSNLQRKIAGIFQVFPQAEITLGNSYNDYNFVAAPITLHDDDNDVAYDIAALRLAGGRVLPYLADQFTVARTRTVRLVDDSLHEAFGSGVVAPGINQWHSLLDKFTTALQDSKDNLQMLGGRLVQTAANYEQNEADIRQRIEQVRQELQADWSSDPPLQAGQHDPRRPDMGDKEGIGY